MDIAKISAHLQEIVEKLGFEFVGTELAREAGTRTLRLYADKEGGITLDDCEVIAKEADLYLDGIADDIEEQYLLEVSSPGLERPLFKIEDYARFAGRPANIRLAAPRDGKRRLAAVIVGTDGENVLFSCDGAELSVPFAAIQTGHLAYVEQKGQKKTFNRKKGKQ